MVKHPLMSGTWVHWTTVWKEWCPDVGLEQGEDVQWRHVTATSFRVEGTSGDTNIWAVKRRVQMEARFKAHLSHMLTAWGSALRCPHLFVNLQSYRDEIRPITQLSTYLEIIVEAPMNHQNCGTIAIVTGQMETSLSQVLPWFFSVYFWDQFTSSCLSFSLYRIKLVMFIQF